MQSWFMHRAAGRALAAPAVAMALVGVLAGCGGGEPDAADPAVGLQGAMPLDGRERALGAGLAMASPDLHTSPQTAAGSDALAVGVTETLKFGAPNGRVGDLFGWSVATLGSRVVVGAPQMSPIPRIENNPGAAYVFDATGSLVRELQPASAAERRRDDGYGRSVAARGELMVVGAPGADDVGFFAGEVFVFDASTGAQRAKLVPTGTRRNPADGSAFGSAVDVSADRIVVGAPGTFIDGAGVIGGHGAMYLYDAGTMRLIARVTPPGTRPKDNVGHSVAVARNTVVAGAPFDSILAPEAGAAYVFNASNGRLRFKLTAADAGERHRFGFSVSTNGTLIAIGAPFDDDRGAFSGSVYLFDARTGAFVRKIVADDAGLNHQFGIAVDLVGNTLAVGAWGDNGGAGSAYAFDVGTGAQLGKFVASDAAPLDILGRSVALWGSTVIAGAARDGDRGADSGSVYRFSAQAR